MKEHVISDYALQGKTIGCAHFNARVALIEAGVRLKHANLADTVYQAPEIDPPYTVWRDEANGRWIVEQDEAAN